MLTNPMTSVGPFHAAYLAPIFAFSLPSHSLAQLPRNQMDWVLYLRGFDRLHLPHLTAHNGTPGYASSGPETGEEAQVGVHGTRRAQAQDL